ncbi:MAG: transposase [Polaromonas sp.]|nr:transposase [Polaromonas sp.]
MTRTRRAFTAELKREAVRQATQPGNTVAGLSRDLGMHESVLRRWIHELSPVIAESPAGGVLCSEEQGRELLRLRRQVENRRIARETIANALRRFGAQSEVDHAEDALVTPTKTC